MKQVIVELPHDLAQELEKVAPARSRRRSEFIRMAIQKAIWEIEEQRTIEAYRRMPDTEPAYFNPAVWLPYEGARSRLRKRRRR